MFPLGADASDCEIFSIGDGRFRFHAAVRDLLIGDYTPSPGSFPFVCFGMFSCLTLSWWHLHPDQRHDHAGIWREQFAPTSIVCRALPHSWCAFFGRCRCVKVAPLCENGAWKWHQAWIMYGKREGGGPSCPVGIINIWSVVCVWKKGLALCL